MTPSHHILYERGAYFVVRAATFRGYEVYRMGLTHATRVASIGYEGAIGLQRAKVEIDRRMHLKGEAHA